MVVSQGWQHLKINKAQVPHIQEGLGKCVLSTHYSVP